MTRRDDRVSPVAMLVYAEEAIEIPGDTDRDAMRANGMMQLALQRLVEKVVEAARRVSLKTRVEHPAISRSEIFGMRNLLPHACDRADLDLLWDAIISDYPPLAEQLEAIVGRDPGRPARGGRP